MGANSQRAHSVCEERSYNGKVVHKVCNRTSSLLPFVQTSTSVSLLGALRMFTRTSSTRALLHHQQPSVYTSVFGHKSCTNALQLQTGNEKNCHYGFMFKQIFPNTHKYLAGNAWLSKQKVHKLIINDHVRQRRGEATSAASTVAR